MRAYSHAQQIDFLALSSCLECPGASAVNASNLIHVIYKADVILLKDLIKINITGNISSYLHLCYSHR